MNKKAFFDNVRLDFGVLSQSQVNGFDFVLDYWKGSNITDVRQFAYILGTIYHETATTMQPIEEFGKGKGKDYGKKLKMNRKPYSTPNFIYYGRGYTQNTWFENYEKLTKLAKSQGHDWDFLNNPDLFLQPEPSIWATFESMQLGLYTGRKLSMYFNTASCDWFGARQVVNGLDRAKLIADYSQKFYKALCSA